MAVQLDPDSSRTFIHQGEFYVDSRLRDNRKGSLTSKKRSAHRRIFAGARTAIRGVLCLSVGLLLPVVNQLLPLSRVAQPAQRLGLELASPLPGDA